MDKGFALAAAAYLLPTFPLGWIWHLKTFRTEYERLGIYRDQVIVPFGFASMLIQAVAFAWIYPRLFSTAPGDWLSSALGFGLVFGALAWSFSTLPVAAKYRMSSIASFLRLETAFTVLHFAIVSPLIALAYRGSA